jgi:hypothetical protein
MQILNKVFFKPLDIKALMNYFKVLNNCQISKIY